MKEILKIWYFYHKLIVFLLDFHFLIDFNTKFSGPIIFFKRIKQPIFDKEKKNSTKKLWKIFWNRFFPFLELNWSHHSIHIPRNAQFTHISNSYKSIGWNSNFEYSIYMPKDPTKKSDQIAIFNLNSKSQEDVCNVPAWRLSTMHFFREICFFKRNRKKNHTGIVTQ